MITIRTSDNEKFVVDRDVAGRSVLLKNLLEGMYAPHASIDCIHVLISGASCRCW